MGNRFCPEESPGDFLWGKEQDCKNRLMKEDNSGWRRVWRLLMLRSVLKTVETWVISNEEEAGSSMRELSSRLVSLLEKTGK